MTGILMARLPWLIRTRFLSPDGALQIAQETKYWKIFRETFLFYHKDVCFVCSLESPRRGDSYEFIQHTIILQKLENKFLNYSHLPLDLALWLTLRNSNYPCLNQSFMVPKMFEPWNSTLQHHPTILLMLKCWQMNKEMPSKCHYHETPPPKVQDKGLITWYYEITPIQIYWKFHYKKWKFSDKNSDIFHISAQNIDCGYSLEPPR